MQAADYPLLSRTLRARDNGAADRHPLLAWRKAPHNQQTVPTLQLIWADQAYQGKLVEWVKTTFSCTLEIVYRTAKTFEVLPRRWVVERTLAWLSRYRRSARVYEKRPASSVAMIYVASIRVMLKKLRNETAIKDIL